MRLVISALLVFVVMMTGCSSSPAADEMALDQPITSLMPSMRPSSPVGRQVFQMNDARRGAIRIAGKCKNDVVSIQARATVMAGGGGKSARWANITVKPVEGTFSGELMVDAGGWYKVDLRSTDSSKAQHTVSVERVGVGLVFVTSGQSNSVCSGSQPMKADDRVSTFNGSEWRQGSDPQLGFTNDLRAGGSPWPVMATTLSKLYDVPVAVTLCGYGGQPVRMWQVDGDHYVAIKQAMSHVGKNGCAAILWHQGESDSIEATPATKYADMLSKMIDTSRADAGWKVPWVIAKASYIGVLDGQEGEMAKRNPVIAGQEAVCDGKSTFIGPTTDDMTGPRYRREDKAHFNVRGLNLHGQRWADSLTKIFDKLHPKWAVKK